MDDEIKLAGLESLVPEELEKHLILKLNRLRTFEDARLEVVTYVEAKCGLKIRDSKPSDTCLREHSEVGAVNSLSSVEGKGLSDPRDGCCKCDGAHFQRDCNARKSTGKQSYGKGRASHSPRVSPQSQAEEKVKKRMEIQRKVQRNRRCDPSFQRLRQRSNTENRYLKS